MVRTLETPPAPFGGFAGHVLEHDLQTLAELDAYLAARDLPTREG